MEEDKNQPEYYEIPEGFPYQLIPAGLIPPGAGLWIRINGGWFWIVADYDGNLSGGTRMYPLRHGPVGGSKVWNMDKDGYYNHEHWLETPNIRPYQGWDDEVPNWWEFQIPAKPFQRIPRYHHNPWEHIDDPNWVDPQRIADLPTDTNISNNNIFDI
jgi:hypothetical protein